jgi:hypothetical protein
MEPPRENIEERDNTAEQECKSGHGEEQMPRECM